MSARTPLLILLLPLVATASFVACSDPVYDNLGGMAGMTSISSGGMAGGTTTGMAGAAPTGTGGSTVTGVMNMAGAAPTGMAGMGMAGAAPTGMAGGGGMSAGAGASNMAGMGGMAQAGMGGMMQGGMGGMMQGGMGGTSMGGMAGDGTGGEGMAGGGGGEVTFADVHAIFVANCATADCHGDGADSGMFPHGEYANPDAATAQGYVDMDIAAIITRVTSTVDDVNAVGTRRMPPSDVDPDGLPQEEREMIQAYAATVPPQ